MTEHPSPPRVPTPSRPFAGCLLPGQVLYVHGFLASARVLPGRKDPAIRCWRPAGFAPRRPSSDCPLTASPLRRVNRADLLPRASSRLDMHGCPLKSKGFSGSA